MIVTLIALIAVGILATAVCAIVALGIRLANRLYHPPRRRAAPARIDVSTPPELDAALVTSRDGLRLALSVVIGQGPGTVIISHGMGRSRASMRRHVRLLHGAGYHVVTYDLRNHGESASDRVCWRMADRFVSDLRDVVGYVRGHPELGAGPVAVLAQSFSTWPAVHVLRDPHVALDAVVCDSGPVDDIGEGCRRLVDLRRGMLPGPMRHSPAYDLLRRAFIVAARAMLGVRGWPTDLRAVPTPLLLIGGENDPIISPAAVLAFAAGHERASHWIVPGATHVAGIGTAPDEYATRVVGFLDAAMRAQDWSPVRVDG